MYGYLGKCFKKFKYLVYFRDKKYIDMLFNYMLYFFYLLFNERFKNYKIRLIRR